MSGRRLDHVSVTVADLDRSLAFYHGLLEMPILGRGEERGGEVETITGLHDAWFKYADLDAGTGQLLELLQYLSPAGVPHRPNLADPGSGHLGIRVDDLDGLLRRVRESGLTPRSAPVVLSGPAWWAGARCVYLADPDGVTVELVERPSGSRT